jgi:hypothetical protein
MIKEKKTKKQTERKKKELEGCTFIPMTNSKRHNEKKKMTHEVVKVE